MDVTLFQTWNVQWLQICHWEEWSYRLEDWVEGLCRQGPLQSPPPVLWMMILVL